MIKKLSLHGAWNYDVPHKSSKTTFTKYMINVLHIKKARFGDWDFQVLSNLLPNQPRKCINVIPPPPPPAILGVDSCRWMGTVDGTFSMATMYESLNYYSPSLNFPKLNCIWSWKGTERLCFLLWKTSY